MRLNRFHFLNRFLKTGGDLLQNRHPGQLIIQLTDQCNATCPHCGMRVTNRYKRRHLDLDRVKQIIDQAAQKNVAALSFTGGEPMLRRKDLTALIAHAHQAGIPFIRTGTNGFFLAHSTADRDRFHTEITEIASGLANANLRNFWISVDSCEPEVHDTMRGFTGLFKGIETALPIFHSHSLYPSVNLGINRNVGGKLTSTLSPEDFQDPRAYLDTFRERYTKALDRFYRRVIDMGFTILNTCYPMSVDPNEKNGMQAVYAATAEDRLVKFSHGEKAILFEVLMDCVKKFRSKIRIFSPLTSLYTLHRHYEGTLPLRHPAAACRGGIDFFFIDAQSGHTFPCGYRGGEDMGAYPDLNLRAIDTRRECRLCDWECFRDPSELFSSFLQLPHQPIQLARRCKEDLKYLEYWISDINYYRSCDFFDGRKPPSYESMARRQNARSCEPFVFSY